jgi:peptidoglycan/LPS O-acetylase OafA/YrhL
MVFELLIVSDRGRARLSLAVSAAVLLLAQMSPATLGSFPNFAYETTITLVFVGILLTTYRFDEAIARWPLTRALGAIGIFSYSIYLTHWLSLGIISQVAKHVPLNEHTFWFVDAAQIIFAVVAAWFFFRVCELPFMRRRPRPAVAGSARKASAPIGVATSSLAPTPEPSSGAISSSGRAQWMSGRFEG